LTRVEPEELKSITEVPGPVGARVHRARLDERRRECLLPLRIRVRGVTRVEPEEYTDH